MIAIYPRQASVGNVPARGMSTRIAAVTYEAYEEAFTAGMSVLAEQVDDAMGNEEWAGAWLARGREVVKSVKEFARVYDADSPENTSVNLGLTRDEVSDALFISGIGAGDIAVAGVPVETRGIGYLVAYVSTRDRGERALERNTVLEACRTFLHRDVTKKEIRDLWVEKYKDRGGSASAFDRIFSELRGEHKIVINRQYMFHVDEDEPVEGYPAGITQPMSAQEAAEVLEKMEPEQDEVLVREEEPAQPVVVRRPQEVAVATDESAAADVAGEPDSAIATEYAPAADEAVPHEADEGGNADEVPQASVSAPAVRSFDWNDMSRPFPELKD